jgi:hypothetical protein
LEDQQLFRKKNSPPRNILIPFSPTTRIPPLKKSPTARNVKTPFRHQIDIQANQAQSTASGNSPSKPSKVEESVPQPVTSHSYSQKITQVEDRSMISAEVNAANHKKCTSTVSPAQPTQSSNSHSDLSKAVELRSVTTEQMPAIIDVWAKTAEGDMFGNLCRK